MKQIIFLLTFVSFFAVQCGPSEAEKAKALEIKEAAKVDSLAKVFEQEIKSLEAETDSLKNLLNDLD
jgi:hypothetical protein